MRWRTKSRDGAATGDPPFPTPPDQTRKEGQSEEGESGMTAIPSQAGDGTARQQQGSGETDELCDALHHRLVTTGEWHRLSNLLEQLLLDSNWSSDMSDFAAQKAKGMENLDLDALAAAIQEKGQASVPQSVQQRLLEKIREFLDRNVEDA